MDTSREQYSELIERELKLAFPEESSAVDDEILTLIVRGRHRGFNAALFLHVAENLFRGAEFIFLVISVTLHAREARRKSNQGSHPAENVEQEYADVKEKFPDLPRPKMDAIIAGIQNSLP